MQILHMKPSIIANAIFSTPRLTAPLPNRQSTMVSQVVQLFGSIAQGKPGNDRSPIPTTMRLRTSTEILFGGCAVVETATKTYSGLYNPSANPVRAVVSTFAGTLDP